jgi:hypothetical protein
VAVLAGIQAMAARAVLAARGQVYPAPAAAEAVVAVGLVWPLVLAVASVSLAKDLVVPAVQLTTPAAAGRAGHLAAPAVVGFMVAAEAVMGATEDWGPMVPFGSFGALEDRSLPPARVICKNALNKPDLDTSRSKPWL